MKAAKNAGKRKSMESSENNIPENLNEINQVTRALLMLVSQLVMSSKMPMSLQKTLKITLC